VQLDFWDCGFESNWGHGCTFVVFRVCCAAGFLGLRVRIQLRAWMYVCCVSCVLCSWISGIAGSNPTEGVDVRLLCFVYVVQVEVSATWRSLVQKIPTGCVWIMCNLETSKMRWPRLELCCCATRKQEYHWILTISSYLMHFFFIFTSIFVHLPLDLYRYGILIMHNLS